MSFSLELLNKDIFSYFVSILQFYNDKSNPSLLNQIAVEWEWSPCLLQFRVIFLRYLTIFTIPVMLLATKTLSSLSTHNPWGLFTFPMKRKNCPSLSRMWIQWLFESAVRIWLWLSVVIPLVLNRFFSVTEGWPVHLYLCFPPWLTTTTVSAQKSSSFYMVTRRLPVFNTVFNWENLDWNIFDEKKKD